MSNQRYMQRGVSASKEDVHNAIKNIDKGVFPKAFCKIIPDILGGDPEYCNIMHADGAGTKSSLAYLYWKETGDLSVWKGIAQDALIMNIDDLLCVGAVDNILVSSTIGRNKLLVPGEVISAIINGTDELLAELREMGVKIAICEVGDEFCPVFRIASLPVDYAFIDEYATASLDRDDAERIAGSLVKYLHYLDVKVIAPELDSEDKIAGAKAVECDGYTVADLPVEADELPIEEESEENEVEEEVTEA